MQTLTSKQKKYLKAKAHPLKPLVQVGKGGVTDPLIQSIDTVLDQHELVKVKFIAFKEEKQDFLDEITTRTSSSFVSLIGHILTLYREHEDPQKRSYRLP
jgi:RNA-binding protein